MSVKPIDLKQCEEVSISSEIKVLAEVEKIWILYDLNNDQSLDFSEMEVYIKDVTGPRVNLSHAQIYDLIQIIDSDKNGEISKHELTQFMRKIFYSKNSFSFTITDQTRRMRQEQIQALQI